VSKNYDIKWHDKEVIQLSEEQLEGVMTEFALTAEGEAKKELIKGHGVLTGTLRRSIHAGEPGYNFSGDDVEPSESTPERGGTSVKPTREGNRFILALGSGMVYALKIHQGWGSFGGYHYITNGVDKTKAKMDTIVARHQVSQ
jgi:hypothetical protein